MSEREPEVRVSYGVKELLGRIDAKLEAIDGKLDTKADIRDVIDLQKRMDRSEKRWEERIAIETAAREKAAVTFTKREKIAGVFIAAVALVLQPLQQHFHF